MQKKRLFGKNFRLTFTVSAFLCCLIVLCYVPILGNGFGKVTTYCEVMLDNEVIGAVSDPTVVDKAFLNARARIARETSGLVLANVECDFQQVEKLIGSTLEQEDLEQVIYELLQEKVKLAKQKHYLVKGNEKRGCRKRYFSDLNLLEQRIKSKEQRRNKFI